MNEKHSVKAAVISFFLFALLFLLHYSDVISISIKTATPIILLPLLCAFSMFSTPAAACRNGACFRRLYGLRRKRHALL